MKEILVLCGCFPKEYEEEYLENTIGLAQIAADRLQKNIIKGICEIDGVTPYVVSAPFVGYYPNGYKKLFVSNHEYESNGVKYKIVGFPTIKGAETYIKSIKLARSIIQWCKASPDNRNIIIYSHYAGFMRALGKAKKRFPDINACCVITDMPELSAITQKSFIGNLKSMPSRIMFHTTYKYIHCVNKFALLSKHMASALSLSDDRFCVVECMCDPDLADDSGKNMFLNLRKKEDVYFAYSGTLDKQYGIKELLEAFISIDDPRLHLWVCGDGNGKEDLLNIIQRDSRIEYFGCLDHGDVIDLQHAADILINPRSSEGKFTKYSFPSKTIEYMLAGKPVIAYKLMGIPDEYDNYLLYIEQRKNGLADCIRKYGNTSKEDLIKIGENNRLFAETNKNYVIQTEKILKMMEVRVGGKVSKN
ncbi:MAG: glycosyltransferase family 4 protein [Prolixibacteraceae bacterium]|nr:glycosyltransferase family 4 protein [Prolixibacteraceae bacterium]